MFLGWPWPRKRGRADGAPQGYGVTATLLLNPICRRGTQMVLRPSIGLRRSSDERLSKASVVTPTIPARADCVSCFCRGFTTWMTGTNPICAKLGTSPVMTESSELCAARSPTAPRRPRQVSRAACVESRQGPAPTPPRLDGYFPRCLSKKAPISPNATAVSGRRSSNKYCACDWPS